jgi:hypothetical protein
MFKHILPLCLIATTVLFSSCSKDDADVATPNLPVSNTYGDKNYDANTTVQRDVIAKLATLTNVAKQGRTTGTVVSADAMLTAFNAGNPSVASVTTAYYQTVLTSPAGAFQSLASNSGGVYDPSQTNIGGTLGGYLFDQYGLEPEQVIEKGLFGAALYNHATTLLTGTITPAKVDQFVAVFGANPTFPNSGSNNVPRPDVAMANYGARRDKNDGQGLYTQFKTNAIKLLVAGAGGDAYKDLQPAIIKELKLIWEKINAATIINYCHTGIARLSSTNPSNNEIGIALHAISEGVGFMHGWKTISSEHKLISDTKIDQVLALLNAPHNASPSLYRFVSNPVNELPKLQQAIQELKTIYSFTDQQVEDFKKNWVTEQGR